MQKRIAAIHDLSCFGKCSLTVALPIVSAMGAECAVVPTALLPGHFAALPQVTVTELTAQMDLIMDQWAGLSFDGIFSGYLGSAAQVERVREFVRRFRSEATVYVADPAMGDRGRLYSGFDMSHVRAMTALCDGADAVLPNVTEACFMLEEPFSQVQTRAQIERLVRGMERLGARRVVLTGVSLSPERVGIACRDGGEVVILDREKIPGHYNGTGDIFASVFTTALTQGQPFTAAARRAMDFTAEVIAATAADPDHRPYGVNFEACLPRLWQK